MPVLDPEAHEQRQRSRIGTFSGMMSLFPFTKIGHLVESDCWNIVHVSRSENGDQDFGFALQSDAKLREWCITPVYFFHIPCCSIYNTREPNSSKSCSFKIYPAMTHWHLALPLHSCLSVNQPALCRTKRWLGFSSVLFTSANHSSCAQSHRL